ncbi:glycosyltransferase family 4 protein [Curtobacterium sp. MCBD17_035]|uniref:glycosyltransferase family 4 protein n=1 Tax=Curtobacterium sp. MCBD17_035 TaxID=2175673 RepID=UPI0015E89693|nr:glycosyltransferase family 4 protein [Curtobacterium sp. MCBD17_035]WIB67973.1 glycosyltransferase family 4 protein [Curtobacterium sp. MCBD17_035]
MAKIVIVQPYVARYRAPLFTELAGRLTAAGHDLVIATGAPTGAQRHRRDAFRLSDVQHDQRATRSFDLGPLVVRTVGSRGSWRDADVVVVELAAGSIDSMAALLSRSSRAVGVWGHVGGYVKVDSTATTRVKRWQVQKADRVLAYSDSGAATAVAWGAKAERVTALQNTVDTAALRTQVLAERGTSPEEIRSQLGLRPRSAVFAYLGGLDAVKRVDLLADTLDVLHHCGADIELVIGGHGDEEHLLRSALERGQVRLLGYADDHMKARIARVASALVNPGRVGLLAVESMALGLPIITTTGARHAPEFEYLAPGVDSSLVAPTGSAIADEVMRFAQEPEYAKRLASAIDARSGDFPLETMVDRMTASILALVEDSRVGRRRN